MFIVQRNRFIGVRYFSTIPIPLINLLDVHIPQKIPEHVTKENRVYNYLHVRHKPGSQKLKCLPTENLGQPFFKRSTSRSYFEIK